MISLGRYEELYPGNGYPSMKDFFSEASYFGKEKIVQYLKSGETYMAAPGVVYDVFTGDRVGFIKEYKDDGEYSWWTSLIYYVEKYNLRLPADFEEKVLKSL